MGTALKQRIWQWRGVLITAPSVAGVLIALRLAGAMQLLELVALDQLFRLRPFEAADPRIIIVTIDESDINQLGRWPMSDASLAQLLKLLKQQQPRAIGLDLYRNLPVEPGHQELVNVFASTPNLIGIKKVVSNPDSEAVEAPSILNKLGQVTASDLVLDTDGRLRRSLLYLRTQNNQTILTIGAKLAFMYLAAEGITPQNVDPNNYQFRLGKAVFIPLQENDGGYIRTNTGGYQILSNFRRFRHGFRKISLTDVLQGRMPANLVRDRIVLIGVKGESLKDNFYTSITRPGETLAGVEVHAQLTSQILSTALEDRPLLRVWPEPLENLWIFVWSGIGAVLGWTSCSQSVSQGDWLGRAAIGILLFGVALLGSAYLLFLAGWWLTVIPPLFALVGAAVVSSRCLLWDSLKLSHKQLEDYARTLEQKVKERTLELEQEIVERKQAEQDLRQQKELLQAIVDHIPVMIVLYDANSQIQFVNQELERTLHWSQAELKDIDLVAECFPDPTARQEVLEHMFAVTGKWLDLKIKTKDNGYVNTSWANISLSNGLRIGIGQDISDRKRAEAASILEERNRMAREIHDGLAQVFTSILVRLQTAQLALLENPAEAQTYIEQTYELTRQGLAEARRSVHALRSQLLEGGLAKALAQCLHQMTHGTSVHGSFYQTEPSPTLPPQLELELFRIGQESITNAIKHAHATEIHVELSTSLQRLRLSVQDNGKGFPLTDSPASKGFGLIGMHERAQRIGGQLTISSQPQQGTQVLVIVDVAVLPEKR